MRGLTQKEVADKVGVASNTYSKWEDDQLTKWDDQLLERIADALNVTLADLKNPLPIVMCFNHSPYSGQITQQNNYVNQELLGFLQAQLQQKDKTIEALLEQLKKDNEKR